MGKGPMLSSWMLQLELINKLIRSLNCLLVASVELTADLLILNYVEYSLLCDYYKRFKDFSEFSVTVVTLPSYIILIFFYSCGNKVK